MKPSFMAARKENEPNRGVTLCSLAASLFAMVAMGGALQFTGTIQGSTIFAGNEALSMPAIWAFRCACSTTLFALESCL